MARIPNGILGNFVGTAGNVSGYMRMGTNFIGAKRRRSSRPMTEGRLAQQQKIKVCNEFTRPFSGSGFFTKTFPDPGSTATGYNRATSAILNQAIAGNYPNTVISYPLVLISKGLLPSPVDASASVNEEGNLIFTWTDNTGTGTAKGNDKAILLAYFIGKKQIIYSLNAGRRADGSATLTTHFSLGAAETWMGFLSNDDKEAANSVYCGKVIL